ncbi:MAG: hypothetical protein EXS50_01915 [Candidatus Taylorbacteria bacterium]|nr:hypothetical protein [Candidatus Taylorbacteria bacterium]
MNQRTFILIGRSGCGKGTQGKLIMEELKKQDPSRNVLYLQSGGEFREFIKQDKYTNQLSRKIMDVGGLQPEFLAVYMWVNFLVKNFNGNENIVMDGMPRKFHEAGVLESIWDFYKIDHPTVIHLSVSKEVSIERLVARGRGDDNREDIAERLSWYETDVVPTIEYYKNNKAYKFIEVDGEKGVEEVWAQIYDQIKN